MQLFLILSCTLTFFGLVWADRSTIEEKMAVPLGLSPLTKIGFKATKTGLKMLETGSVGSVNLLVNGNTLGTAIVSVASEGVTGIGKQAVNTLKSSGEVAISGGHALTDQAMDLTASVLQPIPVVGSLAAVGTSLGKSATSAGAGVLLGVGDLAQKGINGALDLINSSVHEDARFVAELVDAGAGMVESGLKKGFRTIHSRLDQGEKRTLTVTDAIDSRLGLKPPTIL